MTTLQIMTLDCNNIFNLIVLVLSFSGFVISYNKYMKRTVDKADLDKLETKMDKSDAEILHRVERVEDQLRDDITDIKESIKVIHNHILNCKK